MTQLNEAYRGHNAQRIRDLLAGELGRPEAVVGQDVSARLIRAVRRLAQLRARLQDIMRLQSEIEADPMHELSLACRDALGRGIDPLLEDEDEVRREIEAAREQLIALQSGTGR